MDKISWDKLAEDVAAAVLKKLAVENMMASPAAHAFNSTEAIKQMIPAQQYFGDAMKGPKLNLAPKPPQAPGMLANAGKTVGNAFGEINAGLDNMAGNIAQKFPKATSFLNKAVTNIGPIAKTVGKVGGGMFGGAAIGVLADASPANAGEPNMQGVGSFMKNNPTSFMHPSMDRPVLPKFNTSGPIGQSMSKNSPAFAALPSANPKQVIKPGQTALAQK